MDIQLASVFGKVIQYLEDNDDRQYLMSDL